MFGVSEWSPTKLIIGAAALAILVLSLIIWVARPRRPTGELEEVQKEELTLEYAIAWLKDNHEVLRTNSSFVGVVVRYPKLAELISHRRRSAVASGYDHTTCIAIFDKAEERIVRGLIVYSHRLSADLQEQFGEKDMILFA